MGEQTEQGWGVRLAFPTVNGLSEAETARLVTGRPCTGLQTCGSGPAPLCPSRSPWSASARSVLSRAT
ncbi:hypothetical protein E0500_028815 [Streptomyces sp. KM273126]|uniref:hypothetical protein n=1 Tax=Streptomyces sp. KM273126 TaxID=2545247 RepID=UPI00103B060F|nr:hypothetical protein [Streptomyces sp. KM273126]MBA2811291.1 hypothetical protein [Streptomyces sp. KM273126]